MPASDTERLGDLPGCACSPAATGAASRSTWLLSSLISMIASPCSVLVSVFVGDTGVFSSVKVSLVMVRDGAIFAG